MYIPAAYESPSQEVSVAVMTRFPFATLISFDGARPVATHIPLSFKPSHGPNGTLFGHLARANAHGALLANGTESLAIFHGPHAYVSPTWYADHPAVPTWHHVSVHAYGIARILTESIEVTEQLHRLVSQFESGPGAWSLDQAPADYLQRMSAGITAFELPISRMETQCKLGQKRSRQDREQVIDALRRTDRPEEGAVADWMTAFPMLPPESAPTP